MFPPHHCMLRRHVHCICSTNAEWRASMYELLWIVIGSMPHTLKRLTLSQGLIGYYYPCSKSLTVHITCSSCKDTRSENVRTLISNPFPSLLTIPLPFNLKTLPSPALFDFVALSCVLLALFFFLFHPSLSSLQTSSKTFFLFFIAQFHRF